MESMAYFDNLCPGCRGLIDDASLERGLLCPRCRESGVRVAELEEVGEETRRFTTFFREVVGEAPWSLQVMWAKRVFMGRSFAIQAPTGIGKTTFGLVMAAFLEGKSCVILPTKLLLRQALGRVNRFTQKKRVLAYTGKASEKKRIQEGDFDILIITNAFLQRNVDTIPKPFDFVFVDDVDSVLKTPRNIDNLFLLLGLSREEIEGALESREAASSLAGKVRGVLVVSSATLRPRTRRVELFRRILGFDIQRSVSTLREVYDLYMEVDGWDEAKRCAIEAVRLAGGGVFLFVPSARGRAGVEEVVAHLTSHGVEAVSYEEFPKRMEDFVSGRVKAAVGIASSSNALVRGVDLPYHVKLAVFLDVPRFLIPLRLVPNPPVLYQVVRALAGVLKDDVLAGYLKFLKRYSGMKAELLERYPPVKRRMEEVCSYVSRLFEDPEVVSAVNKSREAFIEELEGERFFVVADAASYIQASGRTSRLIPGGLTKGVSLVISCDPKAMESLKRRVRQFMPQESSFKRVEDLGELVPLLEEAERSRKPDPSSRKELFKSALVVVESPNKARTISRFFGVPQRRWQDGLVCYEISVGELYLVIAASVGHVADLVTDRGFFGVLRENGLFKPVYTTIKRCGVCGEQTTSCVCRRCGGAVSQDKLELLLALRRLAFEVDEVFVATDPDAEGEKIAWDLFLSLKHFNPNISRIEFHEVTPSAFKQALAQKRRVDINRVKAQMVRRIADRWVGFTFSQRLQAHFKSPGLSAGRVQTPVLGWVIERDSISKQRVGLVEFTVAGVPFRMEFDPETARLALDSLGTLSYSVSEPYEDRLFPLPPYNTGELLKDASSKLGLSVERTMGLAQQLFEMGFITYHRTDSLRVSSQGISVARRFLEEHYPGTFRPRVWGEGGAHECIRPTRALTPLQLRAMVKAGEIELDAEGVRLYDLIFRRFMASQMEEALVLKRDVLVSLLGERKEESYVVDVLKEGYAVLFPIKTYRVDPSSGVSGGSLRLVPKAYPYTEGTLVEEMKKRGLGKPSTYAKIVHTLLQRRYVLKRKGFIRSTGLGRRVYQYLKGFEPYTSEEFTRMLEGFMDEVEESKRDYQSVLEGIYRVREYLQEEK